MLKDKKTKQELAQDYVDFMMEIMKDGKIYPENLKDAYCSGYLRGNIDALLNDIHCMNNDMLLFSPDKIKEDA